jgi:hypothetical protein
MWKGKERDGELEKNSEDRRRCGGGNGWRVEEKQRRVEDMEGEVGW